jgi:hypothetical protein
MSSAARVASVTKAPFVSESSVGSSMACGSRDAGSPARGVIVAEWAETEALITRPTAAQCSERAALASCFGIFPQYFGGCLARVLRFLRAVALDVGKSTKGTLESLSEVE